MEFHNGNTKKGIKICISSKLNNSIEKIWDKLLNIETLIEICKPMARFNSITNEKILKWETNKEYAFKLFISGFIPFGKHYIVLEILDKESKIILSKEHNAIVKIWNHKILLEYEEGNITKYTDEVIIYAGILTLFVAIWAKAFYKHRQKKWEKISKIL
jgi:hypothetical protein